MNKTLVKNQKAERINFGSIKNQLSYPDFLDIQLQSFQSYFQLDTTPENREQEGLFRVFSENFPITDLEINSY
jgi:DNA-directed RNA polymerase subunit beta